MKPTIKLYRKKASGEFYLAIKYPDRVRSLVYKVSGEPSSISPEFLSEDCSLVDDYEPTTKQQAVLDVIAEHMADKGFPPPYARIAKALGISTGGVAAHLRMLQKKGLVTWSIGEPRSVRVINASSKED